MTTPASVEPAYGLVRRTYRLLPDSVRDRLRWLKRPRFLSLVLRLRRALGGRVAVGPFKGMWVPMSEHVSFLLGTQERELYDVMERIIARQFPTILNIGASEGYYAIGFARRMPKTRVVAFELLERKHPILRSIVARNDVTDRIEIRGACDPVQLERAVASAPKPVLLLVDVEGYERELLDPAKVPALAGATVLVETHDPFAPGVTAELRRRFERTHRIEQVSAVPRTASDLPLKEVPILRELPEEAAVALVDEGRTGVQQWLYLVPNGEQA